MKYEDYTPINNRGKLFDRIKNRLKRFVNRFDPELFWWIWTGFIVAMSFSLGYMTKVILMSLGL
jgi:hypothetical protein